MEKSSNIRKCVTCSHEDRNSLCTDRERATEHLFRSGTFRIVPVPETHHRVNGPQAAACHLQEITLCCAEAPTTNVAGCEFDLIFRPSSEMVLADTLSCAFQRVVNDGADVQEELAALSTSPHHITLRRQMQASTPSVSEK